MTYQIKKIALNLNGRMTVFKVKVADEIILLDLGPKFKLFAILMKMEMMARSAFGHPKVFWLQKKKQWS